MQSLYWCFMYFYSIPYYTWIYYILYAIYEWIMMISSNILRDDYKKITRHNYVAFHSSGKKRLTTYQSLSMEWNKVKKKTNNGAIHETRRQNDGILKMKREKENKIDIAKISDRFYDRNLAILLIQIQFRQNPILFDFRCFVKVFFLLFCISWRSFFPLFGALVLL